MLKRKKQTGHLFNQVKISDGVPNPKTEKEFFATLSFLCLVIMCQATAEYQGRLGIIPYGTKIDMKKVGKNINKLLLDQLSIAVSMACDKFNLTHPMDLPQTNKKSFEWWFSELLEKYDSKKRKYDNFLFSKTTKINKS